MNGLPYYKAYPRDFIEGTVGMSFETKAAYRLVLDLIYMRAGILPDDARYIAGVLGCSVRAWGKYRAELIAAGKIVAENGIILNFRAEKELEIQRSFQEKQAKNARGSNENNNLEKPRPSHTDTESKEVSTSSRVAAATNVISIERGLEAEVYRVGKTVLGKSSGGVISKLREATGYDDPQALSLIEQAAEKHEPMAWMQKVLRRASERHLEGLCNYATDRSVPRIVTREDREWREQEARIYGGVQ